MHMLTRWRAAFAVCVLGFAWCAPEAVRAADFAFSPSSFELTAKDRSGVLTLQNLGDNRIHRVRRVRPLLLTPNCKNASSAVVPSPPHMDLREPEAAQ